MIEKLLSSPLNECADKIEKILGEDCAEKIEQTRNEDCLILQRVNAEFKKFPLRLDVSMLSEIDSLACKTGHNRTEIITILLDYALKHIKLV